MPAFEVLIDRHANAPDDERDAIEDAIFSKIIDHRRQLKLGKVSDEDQGRLAAKINAYTRGVRHAE